jgi:hypothetical protein
VGKVVAETPQHPFVPFTKESADVKSALIMIDHFILLHPQGWLGASELCPTGIWSFTMMYAYVLGALSGPLALWTECGWLLYMEHIA